MLQAAGLVRLIDEIRALRPEMNYILYSGFTHGVIDRLYFDHPRRQLLDRVDVLIDGLYQKENDDDQGLRGSSNQTVWHLTDRLLEFDFEKGRRRTEIYFQNDEMSFIGLPDKKMKKAIQMMESQYVGT